VPQVRQMHRTHRTQASFFSDVGKLNWALCPLMWRTPPATIRKHLPIDGIAHRTLLLLTDWPSFPLHHPQLVPTLSVPPAHPPSDSYVAPKKESRAILLLHWISLAHPPPDYTYLPSLTPHPFMGLPNALPATSIR